MASKSRKRRQRRPRPAAPVTPGQSPSPSKPTRAVRNVDDEAPPAPWGSFPLVELAVLVGLVMLVLGFFFVGGERGPILIATGLALGSIGGLELSIREHLAGYRSHTMVLAAVPGALVLALLFYLGPDGLPPLARAGIGVAVFAAAAFLLSQLFARRSGGQRFKPGRLPGRR